MLLMAQPDAELASRLLELRQYIDQLELECSQLAAEFNASRHWERQGSNSAIDWMRFHCHMTSNAAADRIAVGERAAEMPESVQAMRAGDIGFAHLTVMARTANAVGEAFDEARLLQLARDNSPGKFHYQCLHYRHGVNSQQYAEEQAEQAETNTLHMNRAEDGSFFLTGVLDPIGGAVVRSGGDELENHVLLCARHHRMVHEGNWQLIKSGEGPIITIAPPHLWGGGGAAAGGARGPD